MFSIPYEMKWGKNATSLKSHLGVTVGKIFENLLAEEL